MNVRRSRPQKNLALLKRLVDGQVEFCIVGGVAAVLHGATRMTVDLDIAAPFSEKNLRRLLGALQDLDVRHATRPELRVVDDPIRRLMGFRLLLLETDLGRLDVLREVPPLGEYEALSTTELDVGQQRCRARGGVRNPSCRPRHVVPTSPRDGSCRRSPGLAPSFHASHRLLR